MASKSYSFRLPPSVSQIVESRRREGETSNQALQREVIAYLSSGMNADIEDKTTLEKQVAELVELQVLPLQERIQTLEGKLKA